MTGFSNLRVRRDYAHVDGGGGGTELNNTQHLLSTYYALATHCSKSFAYTTTFNPHESPMRQVHYDPHFTDETPKAKKS